MTEDSIGHYDPPNDIAGGPEPPPPETAAGKTKRPGAPFGIGLTLIICGSLAALGGVFGGLFTMMTNSIMSNIAGLGAAGNPDGMQAIQDAMAASKSLYVVQGSLQVVMGVISVLALIAGIGLMKYRRWGQKLSITWAGLALAYIVMSLIVNFVYILPKSEAMVEAMMAGMPDGGGAAFSGMSSGVSAATQIFYALFLAVLPMLTLIMISKDKIKQCLTE